MRKQIVAGNWKMNMTLQEGLDLAKSVNEMKLVRTKSLKELKTWRDEMLVKILKVIH